MKQSLVAAILLQTTLTASFAQDPSSIPAEDCYLLTSKWKVTGSESDGYFVLLNGGLSQFPLSLKWLAERYYGSGNKRGMWRRDSVSYIFDLQSLSGSRPAAVELISWKPGQAISVGAIGVPGSQVYSNIVQHARKVNSAVEVSQLMNREHTQIGKNWSLHFRPGYFSKSEPDKECNISVYLVENNGKLSGKASWSEGLTPSKKPAMVNATVSGVLNKDHTMSLSLVQTMRQGKLSFQEAFLTLQGRLEGSSFVGSVSNSQSVDLDARNLQNPKEKKKRVRIDLPGRAAFSLVPVHASANK